MLRVIQYSNRYKSILYWATHLPDLTGGKEAFVEWSRKRSSSRFAICYPADMVSGFDFDDVAKDGTLHAVLYFRDETKESKERRKSSGSMSSMFRRKSSSKDLEQSPVPTVATPSPFGSPLDGEDLKSPALSGDTSLNSTSPPSDLSIITLPPSAFEPKAKAKKNMEGLNIKFWTQKGGISLLLLTYSFEQFLYEPLLTS